MITICLDAGHGINTPGKRCLKSIDKNETREWWLNQRIVTKVEQKLKVYSNVKVVRVDDPTGKTDVALKTRTDIANKENATIYCSFHHDAGANGGTTGGISVFTYDARPELVKLRDLLYECLRSAGGLGGRANPKRNADFHVLRETKMNAVLVEHGFMDSATDTPVILSEEYAEEMARGWIDFFEKYFGLKKETPTPAPASAKTTPETAGKYYRVQVGAFSNRENAERLRKEIFDKVGIDALIKYE